AMGEVVVLPWCRVGRGSGAQAQDGEVTPGLGDVDHRDLASGGCPDGDRGGGPPRDGDREVTECVVGRAHADARPDVLEGGRAGGCGSGRASGRGRGRASGRASGHALPPGTYGTVPETASCAPIDRLRDPT